MQRVAPAAALFPTRRSSDLVERLARVDGCERRLHGGGDILVQCVGVLEHAVERSRSWSEPITSARSEEHTSELQSHSDLVCRLLLEKKNVLSIKQLVYVSD